MNELERALELVVARIDDDHWRLARALVGLPAAAPHDRELAVLFHTVRSGSSLLEAALDHPSTVQQHVEWASDVRVGRSPKYRAPSVDLALAG